ncbi:Rrf2 family transcriptional regulator [bacterium]|nr:Rrf2 family transcriptional regulator [bacterium]
MISTKGRYAIRLMVDLARQERERFTPLSEIAERQCISKLYLEIILKKLVAAKYIVGKSGKSGGYKLTKEPEKITVLEILELMEGTVAPVACLSKGAKSCPFRKKCSTIAMWTEYDKMTRDYFGKKTIADLV